MGVSDKGTSNSCFSMQGFAGEVTRFIPPTVKKLFGKIINDIMKVTAPLIITAHTLGSVKAGLRVPLKLHLFFWCSVLVRHGTALT